jgi:hypothetical protein
VSPPVPKVIWVIGRAPPRELSIGLQSTMKTLRTALPLQQQIALNRRRSSYCQIVNTGSGYRPSRT